MDFLEQLPFCLYLLPCMRDAYPRSNCIPSTTSNSVVKPFDSSIVITPSLPTRSIASAINSPTSSSAEEIAATCAIDFFAFDWS